MQIQRIQTLYMLLALIAMAVFIFLPMGNGIIPIEAVDNTLEVVFTPINQLFVGIPAIVAAALTIVSIFIFKKLKLQRQLIVADIAFTIVAAAMVVLFYFNKKAAMDAVDGSFSCSWTGALVVVALVAEILAYKAVVRDHKLLSSYNRLR